MTFAIGHVNTDIFIAGRCHTDELDLLLLAAQPTCQFVYDVVGRCNRLASGPTMCAHALNQHSHSARACEDKTPQHRPNDDDEDDNDTVADDVVTGEWSSRSSAIRTLIPVEMHRHRAAICSRRIPSVRLSMLSICLRPPRCIREALERCALLSK